MANIWLEPAIDGNDKTGHLRSTHLNGERVKALLMEFINQLAADEWINAAYILPKIHYGSNVEATPLDRSSPYYPEWWQYEIKARFDMGHDKTCVVIEVEHFFRSRYYGIAYREIWIPIDEFVKVLNKIYPDPITDDVIHQWKFAAWVTYKNAERNKHSFVCTLRNLENASSAFKAGLNEKAERVNV